MFTICWYFSYKPHLQLCFSRTLCASLRSLLYSADYSLAGCYQNSWLIWLNWPPFLLDLYGVGTTGKVTTAKLINRLRGPCLHLPNIPDMVYKLALAFLWSALAVSCSYAKHHCTNPVVRKEWRAMTTQERAEWIRAINVRIIDTVLEFIILLKHIGI